MLLTGALSVAVGFLTHSYVPFISLSGINSIILIAVSVIFGNLISYCIEYWRVVSFRTKFNNKVALITGGTSGIGLELAKLFVRDGCTVILVSNDSEETVSAAIKELTKINKNVNVLFEHLDL
jgi:NADPH:quinone reductase-like Zn-dependent oxidoreductase